VVNAIVDALRPMGINDVAMPCSPERVWRAVSEAKKAHPHNGAVHGGTK
jgi:carbon-monoxide dehydrogenase large subunit